MQHLIVIPEQQISDFSRKWGIREVALFGSTARGDFTNESDIDLMVQFHVDAHRTLTDMVKMTDELEQMFGRKVDLITKQSVENSPNYIRRNSILKSAKVIYAE